MGEKVPVVTTSTSLAASSGPMSRTALVMASAVSTTALPCRMRALISAIVLLVLHLSATKKLR